MGLEAGGREITCFISIQEAKETGSGMRLYTLKHHLPTHARAPRDSLQANLKQRHLLGNHMFNYLSFWGARFLERYNFPCPLPVHSLFYFLDVMM